MKYVLDSNIALKWVLAERDSPKAERLRDGNSAAARDWFERSNAWFKQRTDLSAAWSKELTGFRAEAAALLDIKDAVPASGR
jgi:hypothetical protein